jgi:hypothetical protein
MNDLPEPTNSAVCKPISFMEILQRAERMTVIRTREDWPTGRLKYSHTAQCPFEIVDPRD